MTTTAEGVETKGQLDCLLGKDCTEVQGYLYAKPVPGSDVLGIIRKIKS